MAWMATKKVKKIGQQIIDYKRSKNNCIRGSYDLFYNSRLEKRYRKTVHKTKQK